MLSIIIMRRSRIVPLEIFSLPLRDFRLKIDTFMVGGHGPSDQIFIFFQFF